LKILGLEKEKIEQAIKSGAVTIAVYGAGKVGLPIAVVFAEAGAKVIAVDINEEVVEQINQGINPVKNEAKLDEKFASVFRKGNLKASSDLINSAKESAVIIVIVPTILDETNTLNLTPLKIAFENIGLGLQSGALVILESTVPPGFVESIIIPILEKKSGLKAGKDFGVGFSPERVYSGRIIPDLVERYPKIVSGVDSRTVEAMVALYGTVIKKEVRKLSSIRAAETMKVFEGIYRDVNLALANELALVAEKLGVDIMEIIEAANTQPFSNILIPGAGVGGHCIPVYPYFIINHKELEGLDLHLMKTARQINEHMPHHIIELLEDCLKELKLDYADLIITIMGLAFRGDVKEFRNSPTLKVAELLKDKSSQVKCFDPLFSTTEILDILGIPGVTSIEGGIQNTNCLIFLTDHQSFKELKVKILSKMMNDPKILIDGRQLFNPEEVIRAGICYRGIGRKI